MDSVYECLPAIITDADRPLALQRLQQTSALSAMLECMLQLKVSLCAVAQAIKVVFSMIWVISCRSWNSASHVLRSDEQLYPYFCGPWWTSVLILQCCRLLIMHKLPCWIIHWLVRLIIISAFTSHMCFIPVSYRPMEINVQTDDSRCLPNML
jgi:hypothetical protein